MTRTDRLTSRLWAVLASVALVGGMTLVPVTASAGVSGSDARSSNDNFANAQDVGTPPHNWTQPTAGNTTEPGEPLTCGGISYGVTVWYSVYVPQHSTVTVATANSDYDTVVAVFTGASVGSLSSVGCNDDASASVRTSQFSFEAYGSSTYRIQIGGYHGDTGSLHLQVSSAMIAGQPNDMFANSQDVGSTTSFTQSTIDATWEDGEPDECDGYLFGATVWYRMSVAQTTEVTLDTKGSNFDTFLSVYTGGSIGSLSRVICNDDLSATDVDSQVVFTANPGTVYRIQIGGFDSPAHGIDQGTLHFHVATVVQGGGGSAECLGQVATLVGTEGNDTIYGTSGDDVIDGLGGNDRIFGRGGNDLICGGLGNDTIKGGKGDDTISGENGTDTIRGGKGSDTIYGGEDADNVYGGGGGDTISGGSGDDLLKGSKGDDLIDGDAGWDVLRGGPGIDHCVGENVICEF